MAHYTASQLKKRKRVKHYLEYALLRAMLFVINRLPLSLALWKARRLGDFAFDVVRIRRRVTLDNLRRVFGEKYSNRQLTSIARSTYRNFAMTLVEFAYYGENGIDQLGERMTVNSYQPAQEAEAKGKGILFMTAHTGNWELLGAKVSADFAPIAEISGDQKNIMVDAYTKKMRERLGLKLIPIGSSLKEVIRTLRAKGRVALVADQDGGRDGIMIDFLGKLASTAVGPARFSYRTGAPLVMGLDRHLGGGHHEAILYPPIYPDTDRPEKEEIRRILEEYSTILESFIRQYPDQWLWMHRRWKTQLPADKG